MRHAISPARHLLDKLRAKSNFANGRVWYGRAISYSKIASWFGAEAPSERTLQRWMAELRGRGVIIVRREPFNQGMRVTIAAAARQGNLFHDQPRRQAVQKPVQKLRNSQAGVPPRMAAPCRQVWREKEVYYKEQYKEIASAPAAAAFAPIGCAPKFAEDRKPWTMNERSQKLREFYALKRTLGEMALGHPRFGELSARHRWLEIEFARHSRAPAIENSA